MGLVYWSVSPPTHWKKAFISRYIGHLAARARLGPCERPEGRNKEIVRKGWTYPRFRDVRVYGIYGNTNWVGSATRSHAPIIFVIFVIVASSSTYSIIPNGNIITSVWNFENIWCNKVFATFWPITPGKSFVSCPPPLIISSNIHLSENTT